MKKISIFIFAVFALISVSCDKDFEEVNTDPNNPTKVPSHLLLGNILRVNQNTIYGMQQGGDMGMCWAQHLSKVQYNDEERYIPRRGNSVSGIDGVWTQLYVSVIADAQSMGALAEAEGNKNIQAISLVLQANAFQILTDLYGPIPFKDVNKKGVLQPSYDTQEDVYTGLIKMLTDADALFAAASATETVTASSDLLYSGDVAKWRRLANSLKFKALMRISNKVNVSAQLQALVDAGNLMQSVGDNADLDYLAAQPDANPIYETIVYGTRTEYKMSSVFINKLTAYGDPRLPVMAAKNNAGLYVGNIPGEENTSNYLAYSSPGALYLDPKLKGVVLSYAQAEFYRAEAASRGLISGGIAESLIHYNKGIEANFLFNGLTVAQAAAYAALPNITYSNAAGAKNNIGDQMWISLFGQGFEAWTEWRRTGVPALSPVKNAAESKIPTRLYYESNEISLNKQNYNAGVALLGAGGDQLTTPIWWMN
jgi:hypothetical protein